jgi:hypothetical protein
MTRQIRWAIGGALLLVLAGCSSDDEPHVVETTFATEPAITAPPTASAEEQAKEEILATFESLIAARDDYYANASDYTVDELSENSPILDWPMTGQAEGELFNWATTWRTGEVETVGKTDIIEHDVSEVRLNLTGRGIHEAVSRACLDMTGLDFRTYNGKPAELPYEPTRYQQWDMTWIYEPEAVQEAGVDEPGWYMKTINLAVNKPC